jgi:hypothetical protein
MGKSKAHGEAVADNGGECGLDKRTLMRPLFVIGNDGHKPVDAEWSRKVLT